MSELPRIRCDWNHLDGEGRVRLSDLAIHNTTDWAALEGQSVLLVQGNETVFGTIARMPDGEWVGVADWSTQTEG